MLGNLRALYFVTFGHQRETCKQFLFLHLSPALHGTPQILFRVSLGLQGHIRDGILPKCQ